MPISPAMTAYQAQMGQQGAFASPMGPQGAYQAQMGMMPQGAPASEQAVYNKKFGDVAYTALASKYPGLVNQIVTFKIIEADLDKSMGLGAFIIRKGADVVYIPVVLAGGQIVSCEMIYDKTRDAIEPLIDDAVKALTAAGLAQDPTIVRRAPAIEDTRNLFRQMIRPPASSNVIVASASAVETLPNRAKQALAAYFEAKPELLAKVADFYPVEVLASKLACLPELDKQAAAAAELPAVIRVEELTKEAAKALSAEERQEGARRGYIVKRALDDATVKAVATRTLPTDLAARLNLFEKGPGQELYGTGFLLRLDGADITAAPCLVAGREVFTKQGRVSTGGSVVLAGFKDSLSAEDLTAFGAQKPEGFADRAFGPKFETGRGVVFFPTKAGTYKLFDQGGCGRGFVGGSGGGPGYVVKRVEGDLFIESKEPYAPSLGFVASLSRGHVQVSDQYFLFPKTALGLVVQSDAQPYIASLSQLHALLRGSSVRLSLVADGAGLTLVDSTLAKSASFKDEAALVLHLVEDYRLDKTAVDQLLAERDVLLLPKLAAAPALEQSSGEVPADLLSTTGYAAPNPHLDPAYGAMPTYPQIIDNAAEIGDPDLMDTGMLASMAGDADIKVLLLDQLPLFSSTLTSLGKTILLFTVNQKEIEAYYGREEYNNLLSNVRKVFRTLGEIVFDLKSYTKMN